MSSGSSHNPTGRLFSISSPPENQLHLIYFNRERDDYYSGAIYNDNHTGTGENPLQASFRFLKLPSPAERVQYVRQTGGYNGGGGGAAGRWGWGDNNLDEFFELYFCCDLMIPQFR